MRLMWTEDWREERAKTRGKEEERTGRVGNEEERRGR